MKVDVIVGGLYWDEGKGKIVSNFGAFNNYDYIFRVNASTNASHTVSLKDKSDKVFVTKQLPSVFFNYKDYTIKKYWYTYIYWYIIIKEIIWRLDKVL